MNQRLVAFSRFLLGVAVVFTANFVAASIAPQGASLRWFDLVYRPLSLVFLLAGFAILIAGFERAPGNPLVSMGLAARPPWLRDLWVGVLLGAGMVTVAVTVVALAGTLTIRVVGNAHTARLALAVLIILVTGAIAEEISFRGYPFQRLVEAVGPTVAVVVLSVLFGIAHLWNPHASNWGYVNTVLIGILLALAYLRTRSLWMPIGVHFSWNATLGLVFGLPVSGLTEFSVITRARAEGPPWLTGGSYGIEASALGAIIIVAGTAVLLALVRQREISAKEDSPPAELVCIDDSTKVPAADVDQNASTEPVEPSTSHSPDGTTSN